MDIEAEMRPVVENEIYQDKSADQIADEQSMFGSLMSGLANFVESDLGNVGPMNMVEKAITKPEQTSDKLKQVGEFAGNVLLDVGENVMKLSADIGDAIRQAGLPIPYFKFNRQKSVIPGASEGMWMSAEEGLAERKKQAKLGDATSDMELMRIGDPNVLEEALEPMASFLVTMFIPALRTTKMQKGVNTSFERMFFQKGMQGAALASATLDLEDGNIATFLKDLGMQNDVIEYLSSRPEDEEVGFERLLLRTKNVMEEGAFSGLLLALPYAFRIMKANKVKFMAGGAAIGTFASGEEAEAGPITEIGKLLLKSRKEISKIKDASIFNGKLNRKYYDLAKTEVNRIKQNYLAEDGWVEPKIAEGGTKPAVVFNPDGSIKSINWQGVPYKFHISNKGLSTEDHKAELVSTMVNDVKSIVQRARDGDQTAINILKEADWYRAMRSRLRTEFGGIADVFVDVIGATSANTGVTVNWDNALEVLTRFTKGEFDEEIKLFEERVKRGETVSGKTITALHKDKDNPFKLISKASGKLFGINSPTSTGALLDMFRQIKAGDSPKTKNFAGNLIGSTTDATIDVWAARYLRRAAGYDRIPPNSEVGVSGMHLKGSTNENPRIGGEFGFGQSVFSDANAALKADGLLAEYGGDLANMNDDDLQAIVWFMEKEIWTKNGWTTKAGEGGSLDFEASLAGSANPERVKELRTIINSKNSGEQEILDASVELKNLSAPLQRYVLGVSAERPGNIPTNAKQAEIANDLNSVLVKDDNVVAFQNNSTIGLFGGQVERALNSEIVTRSGFNASDLVGKLVQVGKANNQDAVFVSKVVDETHPNGRPGVEFYFAKTKDAEYIKEVTEYIRQMFDVDGFTAITDARFRDRVDLQVGTNAETAGLNGIRLQYIPEFAGGEFNEVTKKAMAINYAEMLYELEKRYPDINFTKVMHYDTTVYVNRSNPETDWISGGTSYEDIIGPASKELP